MPISLMIATKTFLFYAVLFCSVQLSDSQFIENPCKETVGSISRGAAKRKARKQNLTLPSTPLSPSSSLPG